MKTSFLRKGASFFMAILMCFTAFLGIGATTAYAAGEQATVYLVSFPRDGDANYGGAWGTDSLTLMNGWKIFASDVVTLRAMNSYEGNICYCIEVGVSQHTGDVFTSRGEDYWDNYPSDYNSTISPDEIKTFIGRILQYGYTGPISTSWRSQDASGDTLAHALATQYLIWETVVGERDSNFDKVGTGGYNAVVDKVSTAHPLYSQIMGYYNSIVSSVQRHSKVPSFFARSASRAQSVELEWNGSQYSTTLTDHNGVLGDYSFSASESGISFSVHGNQLTITAAEAPSDTVTITASKINGQRRGIITWTDGVYGPNGQLQDTVTYAQSVSDPVTGYLHLKVSYGSAKIVKTSEDGKVSGITFNISGNGINQTVTTNSAGEIQIDNLAPGTYTITEQGYDKYEPQETRTVNVVSGQVASVAFSNVLKRGDLVVTKTSEDGLVEGMTFHLYGTSLSGIAVDEYAVTDSSGKAYFNDVLIGTGYVLEEVDVPVRYVVPDTQTAAIEWNTVTGKSFSNVLKKWNATVTKTDAETGVPQGDASLAGAQYGVFRGEELVDTYVTDANGQFTTSYYVCGYDWSIREIASSEGYLVDETVHPVGAEPELYTVEHNSVSMAVTEQVIKGDIALIKHTDDGETQLETPEAGAEFAVYLKSAGSYDAAKESERDYLTCDEYGFAQTKLLPYGIYTVHQVSGWEGRELLPDFDVYIAQNGQTYRYLANNANFESYIKIVKVDAETSNVIPYAGAGFQLYRPDGSLITQTFTYPEVTTIDTFYTNDEGCLITPETLEYGSGYSLVEVSAPYGYVLNTEPVYFDVTVESATEESAVTVIEVIKANTAQKGIIKISKSGEVFASVTESDGIYQPVYAVQGLPGAVYEVTAAEDIYTLDGTLRAATGEVVDTVTTDETGLAQSKPLYLGKYEIREITAPYGMVVNNEIHTAELVYAGQEIEITETAANFYNERQKAGIRLDKAMEQDEVFGIGGNGEITAVTFGLYAASDMVASDGSVIPAGGLLEILSVHAEGYAACSTDLPIGSYYVQELSTDSHYILSEKQHPVVFEYAGQEIDWVEIRVNDGDTITNDLIYGEVYGLKTDDSGNGLGGALIGLFHPDTTEFTADTAILTTTSADDGGFSFVNIPYGNWMIREISAPSGFVLSNESYPVVIDSDGAVVEVTIGNILIRGSIQITKVDKEYPDNKLSGAEFVIYRDVNRDKALGKEDEQIGTMTEVSTGVYEMTDLLYGDYFVQETKAPDGFYLDSTAYYFSIEEHGEIVTVETEVGKGFVNAAQVGSLKIIKTSSDGKVEGFSFRVSGANGYEQVFTTDEKGEILIEGLRIGDYTVSEISDSASQNYVLPADKTAAVFEGAVTKVEMHNELRDTPKTGDERNPALWLALAGATGAGAIALGAFAVINKKKKEDAE